MPARNFRLKAEATHRASRMLTPLKDQQHRQPSDVPRAEVRGQQENPSGRG
jgi:hypothetical protein